MSVIKTTKRDKADLLQKFRSKIDALAATLRNRRGQGWDAAALEQVAHDVDRLHSAAARIDPQWASALAQVRGPLSAARQSQQLPDPAVTASLVSTTEQLLMRLQAPPGYEHPAQRPAGQSLTDEPAPATTRAETPPPQYWRRWADDAAPSESLATTSFSRTETMTATNSPDFNAAPHPAHAVEAPYRVLIVEDDRAQALFAESVLNGAGIEAFVVSDPTDVLETMARVSPELVLMDLHMPGLSGTELTALIRLQEAFLHTPIVFLTGDPDPEKQFEVLECGADDFLQKPIRPRHLVAAVESRLKRARAVGQNRIVHTSHNATTGLLTRPHLLRRLGDYLPGSTRGGVFFLEIEGAASLRERYGYAAMEWLMTEAGRHLAILAGGNPAARLNDNAFLVFCPELEPSQLQDQARALRDGFGRHPIEINGDSFRLRLAVGYASLQHGFGDAGAALEAAEVAAKQARSTPVGLSAYAPPERAGDHQDLAADIRSAMVDERFELIYQPIVAVAGGDEAQYQTLLRLRRDDGTLHNAAEIVPAAESAGLMQDIDRWVLERALDVMQQRRAQSRPVRLFVPQSPRTLARDGYADWLIEAITARALDGPSLVIDLRLTDALIHTVTLRQFCEQMVPVGVQFCLSQYEHSSDADALLAQLPLGYLRLSARYAEINGGGDVRDEMRVAIERAHRLGLQVVGHRVEDPQAAATLWMSGIDYIQGNLVQQAAGELDFDFQHAVL
jgi:EAL domain-containing protein (putative c-di-GMP-specific phosphodiesterase class I)/PleD family two-component response regulator